LIFAKLEPVPVAVSPTRFNILFNCSNLVANSSGVADAKLALNVAPSFSAITPRRTN